MTKMNKELVRKDVCAMLGMGERHLVGTGHATTFGKVEAELQAMGFTTPSVSSDPDISPPRAHDDETIFRDEFAQRVKAWEQSTGRKVELRKTLNKDGEKRRRKNVPGVFWYVSLDQNDNVQQELGIQFLMEPSGALKFWRYEKELIDPTDPDGPTKEVRSALDPEDDPITRGIVEALEARKGEISGRRMRDWLVYDIGHDMLKGTVYPGGTNIVLTPADPDDPESVDDVAEFDEFAAIVTKLCGIEVMTKEQFHEHAATANVAKKLEKLMAQCTPPDGGWADPDDPADTRPKMPGKRFFNNAARDMLHLDEFLPVQESLLLRKAEEIRKMREEADILLAHTKLLAGVD